MYGQTKMYTKFDKKVDERAHLFCTCYTRIYSNGLLELSIDQHIRFAANDSSMLAKESKFRKKFRQS